MEPSLDNNNNNNKKHLLETQDPPQFLRVRRRRNAITAECLRVLQTPNHHWCFENEQEQDEALQIEQQQQQPAAVCFRRVSETVSNHHKRRRVWDAVLLEDDQQEQEQQPQDCFPSHPHDDHHPHKRRRITLQFTQPPPKYPVLTPLQRLVDDSLRQVFTGDVTVSQHLALVGTHPDAVWFGNHQHGTLLHAAALWNEVECVGEILGRILNNNEQQQRVVVVHEFLQRLDEQGRTALDVATLAGHDQVGMALQDALLALEDDTNTDSHSDFCYDLYQAVDDDSNNNNNMPQNNSTEMADCDIVVPSATTTTNGYWNADGQLTVQDATAPFLDIDNDHHDDDDSSTSQREGLDYPEEEEEDTDDSTRTSAGSSVEHYHQEFDDFGYGSE